MERAIVCHPLSYSLHAENHYSEDITVTLKFPRAERVSEDRDNTFPATPSEQNLNSMYISFSYAIVTNF